MNNGNDYGDTSKEVDLFKVAIAELTDRIKNIAPNDGFFSYDISCMHLARSSKNDMESVKTFFQPSLNISSQ
jgi:hypothetical protein